MLSCNLAVYKNQKIAQKYNQHFLITRLALLQLGYHPLKYPFILQGRSCVKNTHIIFYPIAS